MAEKSTLVRQPPRWLDSKSRILLVHEGTRWTKRDMDWIRKANIVMAKRENGTVVTVKDIWSRHLFEMTSDGTIREGPWKVVFQEESGTESERGWMLWLQP